MNETTVDLKGYICSNCGWTSLTRVQCCRRCHSKISEKTFPGEGTIATFTFVRYPPEGFEEDSPYVVALVDIEHGPRVIGRVTGPVERLEIGKVVTLSMESKGVLEFRLKA